jgi:hypothetical protein
MQANTGNIIFIHPEQWLQGKYFGSCSIPYSQAKIREKISPSNCELKLKCAKPNSILIYIFSPTIHQLRDITLRHLGDITLRHLGDITLRHLGEAWPGNQGVAQCHAHCFRAAGNP